VVARFIHESLLLCCRIFRPYEAGPAKVQREQSICPVNVSRRFVANFYFGNSPRRIADKILLKSSVQAGPGWGGSSASARSSKPGAVIHDLSAAGLTEQHRQDDQDHNQNGHADTTRRAPTHASISASTSAQERQAEVAEGHGSSLVAARRDQ
jgi:hypothetical protein